MYIHTFNLISDICNIFCLLFGLYSGIERVLKQVRMAAYLVKIKSNLITHLFHLILVLTASKERRAEVLFGSEVVV